MMQLKMKYILFTILLLAFTACDNVIHDEPQEEGPTAYLNISTRMAHTDGKASVNTDKTDFEDRMYNLALLVFDSSTGNRMGTPYFKDNLGSGESAYAFTAKLKTGSTCDFYFVGNLPAGTQNNLENIADRTAMDAFMGELRNLDEALYRGAADDNGFPVSRVYRNQPIPAGGTLYQPAPFKPKYTQGGTMAVLTENGTVTEEPCVMLARAVAKLEVTFTGADLGIAEVKFHNAFRQYSPVEQDPPVTSPSYQTDATLTPITGTNTYVYYMPEALLPVSTAWTAGGDHKPVNYFSVKTTDGTTYEIPVISYGIPGTDPNATPEKPYGNYLDFATGKLTNKPDYNIYRNHHYKFTIKNLETIEILYEIDPWEKENKSLYMGYGYNVEVDGKTVTVSNTFDACAPHNIVLKTVSPYTFTDGTDTKTFMNGNETEALKLTASEAYTLNTEPTTGAEYLEVWYNGIKAYIFKL